MAILEKVIQMRQQGITDPEIIGALRQEGVSPNEINEALSQAKVKSALDFNPEAPPEAEGNPDRNTMELSMMQSDQVQDQRYAPYAQEGQEGGEGYQDFQGYSPEYATGEAYPEYQPRPTIDIETVNEICEQTIEEKTDKLKKEISSISKFKDETGFEVQKMNERLTKIENNLNDLQMAILRKVGSYGEDIKNIAREMHATQESFSKMIDPMTDNLRELQKINDKEEASSRANEEHVSKGHHHKKSKNDFESYLR